MSRCQNCYSVEQCVCEATDDWVPTSIFDDLASAQEYARRLSRGRVVPTSCDEMLSCVRECRGAGGVVRYARNGEATYSPHTSTPAPYAVEQLVGSDDWQVISRGRSIDDAIKPLGGRRWWVEASPDQYRVRTPDGVIAPLGRSRPSPAGQPQRQEAGLHPLRPQPSGPRVNVSFPVPVPVTPRSQESPPMTPQKFHLARGGQVVRVFDTQAEAERAVVHFRRCDPVGHYHITSGGPVRYARTDAPADTDTDAGTRTGVRDLGAKKRDRYCVEVRTESGEWERVSDTFDSAAEAQAELVALAREEKDAGDMRVVQLGPDDPDELPDDDQGGDGFDPDNPGYFAGGGPVGDPNLGNGGSYPNLRAPARGGDGIDEFTAKHLGNPTPGGPRNPEEAQRVAKFARKHGITDAAEAWSRLSRGR
jgi:hypothetical protein